TACPPTAIYTLSLHDALPISLVGDQHAERDALRQADRLQHIFGVGQLRDHIGTHEARDLDTSQTAAPEQLDKPNLVGRRDHLRLVLKPVAGTDFADADALWDCA